jgi:hypothetical protein
MQSDIQRMWEIFSIHAHSVLELRAISPANRSNTSVTFRGSEFTSVETLKRSFEQKALELNACGFNTYIVMNPIKEASTSKCFKDTDIACRRLLLIDIDRAQKVNAPATDAEVEAARIAAMQIREFTTSLRLSAPIMVMSGNGYHLYYRLDDLPNTDDTTRLISKTLRNIAKRFDNDVVHVDTNVSNASRITKIPGTVAYKGTETHERPFRKAEIK